MALSLLAVPVSERLAAETGVRECIAPSAPGGHAYRLDFGYSWKMIGTLEFNHQTTSDYIVTGVVFFPESNTPDNRVEYQFTLDGVPHGWYTRRVPDNYPTSQTLRTVISDVPGGIHVLGIRARNLSSAPVYFSRFWLSPLLVESSETRARTSSSSTASAGSSWTTLLSKNSTVPSDRMAYVAAFTTVAGGTPSAPLEYRILRGSTEIAKFDDSVPEAFPDGVHLAFIDRFPGSGLNTYQLQARSPSGSTVTFSSRELDIQTLPEYTVFEAGSTSKTIPNDDQWYTLSSTSWQQIAPISRGSNGTDGSGYGYFTHTGPLNAEAEARFQMEFLSNGSLWEIGWVSSHPTGETALRGHNSDWEQLGLSLSDHFKVRYQARGLCQGSPDLQISKNRFQIMVIPDNTPYTHAACPNSSCCDNHSSCLAYTCSHSGQLALVGGIPSRDCY